MAFKTPDEQNETVNRILEVLISAYPELERSSFATIEWSLNEIMDNVIVHSESKTGGLVQLKVHRNKGKEIEIVVSDSGVGIVESLKNVYKNRGKMEILFESINEGVTNGKGQGNGLFGTSEVCRVTNGEFSIHTGDIALRLIKMVRLVNLLKVHLVVLLSWHE